MADDLMTALTERRKVLQSAKENVALAQKQAQEVEAQTEAYIAKLRGELNDTRAEFAVVKQEVQAAAVQAEGWFKSRSADERANIIVGTGVALALALVLAGLAYFH